MDVLTRNQSRARHSALVTGVHTIGWPAAAFFALILYVDGEQPRTNPVAYLALAGTLSAAAIFGGIISGFTAHQMFIRTSISTKFMAFCFGLLIDLMIAGWLIVIVNQRS